MVVRPIATPPAFGPAAFVSWCQTPRRSGGDRLAAGKGSEGLGRGWEDAAGVGLDTDQVTGDPPVVSHPEYPLPEVQLPAGVVCNDLSLQGSVTITLPSPGTYCFRNLSVRGGAVLTSDGPVTIYLSESLSFEGDSTIGVVNDPTQFLFLMASGTNITMEGSIEGEAEIYGAMYGPDATFDIEGDAIIYGSVIGNEVHMSGDSRLHYDEALADVNLLSNEGIVEIISWREVT